MLQTFEGTLENGHIVWDEPNNVPKKAKVLVTVLYPVQETPTAEKPSRRFRGALKHLTQTQKDAHGQQIQELRNEWERDI
ncbi:hypothetical protein [Runella sp.]|uniref:hypothetical protein n=1 Tax=Runella sp. TaxID=1960881 RepID=UPI003D14723F